MTAPEPQFRAHWDGVYSQRAIDKVSWFEATPARSLEWIAATGVAPEAALIDVGGGASTLVDELLARGHTDITLLDVSGEVLELVGKRLGERRRFVELIALDVTTFRPSRTYALWHDRAVFHFMTDEPGRRGYLEALLAGTHPGSHILLSTFGPEGPTRCSGLPTARYDADALATALGRSFRLMRSALEIHTTPGGAAQQFLHTHFTRE
jgi:hypothetical protein